MKKVAEEETSQEQCPWSVERGLTLDELAREGARKMLEAALQLEVSDYVERHHSARDAEGLALVVRNGNARPRPFTIGSGTMSITAPRVNDKRVVDGERMKCVLPARVRDLS